MSQPALPPPGWQTPERTACVFANALMARAAVCEKAGHRSVGERYFVECRSPVSAINCATLAALLHERARVSFGLPCAGEPVTHAMALRLQCGGLSGLRQSLGATDTNVHALIGAAHERHASLTALPWQEILLAITCWQPKRRRARPP